MAEINWVRVIADQSCTGKLERKHRRPNRWVNASGSTSNVEAICDGELVSKLIVSAVLVTDAAIMRMMR